MEHHGIAGPAWALALQQSWLGDALRSSVWLYPAVESLHILGLALLFGAIASFDIRVLRGAPRLAVETLAAQLLPIARAGFALAVPMGLLLFITEATAYLANPAFLAKMALLVLAALNILWFHARFRAGSGPDGAGLGSAVRLSAFLSLGLWVGVVLAGRLIAYV